MTRVLRSRYFPGEDSPPRVPAIASTRFHSAIAITLHVASRARSRSNMQPRRQRPISAPFDPLPVAVPPAPFDPVFAPSKSGVPAAPAFPFGPAANVPDRLPAGTALSPRW